MGFVNEYVSEDDIEKYNLEELIRHYLPFFSRAEAPQPWRPLWTIDRERGIVFMSMKSGREDLSNRITWMLIWNGSEYKIEVDKFGDPNQTFESSPFIIEWSLVRTDPEPTNRNELIEVLKEALTAHGYGGARRQVPNTVVNFRF